MNKIELIIGLLIGLLISVLGSYLFINLFTEYDFDKGFKVLKSHDSLGKLITLGSLPNLCMFLILIKLHKEMMARGIVMAVIIMSLLTLLL